jgi:hypothetical protein
MKKIIAAGISVAGLWMTPAYAADLNGARGAASPYEGQPYVTASWGASTSAAMWERLGLMEMPR